LKKGRKKKRIGPTDGMKMILIEQQYQKTRNMNYKRLKDYYPYRKNVNRQKDK
jgi:hypothetical protein